MPRGRPRLQQADDDTQAKRDYQRQYQQARKDKITQLTTDIQRCEDDLKKMKKERADLKKKAREKIDKYLVGVPFDPDDSNAVKKAFNYKRQQAKGNKIKN
jgi:uncharacterized membrane protein YcaP (DUF421 family)